MQATAIPEVDPPVPPPAPAPPELLRLVERLYEVWVHNSFDLEADEDALARPPCAARSRASAPLSLASSPSASETRGDDITVVCARSTTFERRRARVSLARASTSHRGGGGGSGRVGAFFVCTLCISSSGTFVLLCDTW